MSVPRSVVKLSKNGVTYTSSVDRAAYTIRELTRAALRDVGRFVAYNCNDAARQLKGLKIKGRASHRVSGKTSAFQFWVRRNEGDLQVGIKHDTWYGVQQELGSSKQPKRQILRNTVYNNIPKIVEIESQYLSALEDEAAALAKIDEGEYIGGADD